jgi:prepilin-type N-terminal cleavage/methylation domain-containing protein/prepilin-type processing-associated H-X9-DG protein
MDKDSCPSHAFTLIELIVVLAVIAILMSMVYPMYTGISERAKATKDLSNLRQIGIATQTYLNDSDGVLFSAATPWTSQLNPKYFSAWRGFQSPFDKRSASEAGGASTPISYGVNANIYSGGDAALSATKITKPTAFILFAPAQASGTTVSFSGLANSPLPGVTVLGVGSNTATSNPGGNATGGTHNGRKRVNALFADLHSETMSWATFTNNAATGGDPDGELRWKPYTPFP